MLLPDESVHSREPMTMTKDEAEPEAIRRFRQLPLNQRQQIEDAETYARRLDTELEFHTVTNKQKLIAAWLIREIVRARTSGDTTREATKPAFAIEGTGKSGDAAAAA
jgi:hypothetical protein